MSDAPSYRATAQVYVDRLYEKDQTFSSNAVPGKAWEPLNEAAVAAVAARAEAKKTPNMIPPSPAAFVVEVPPHVAAVAAEVAAVEAELAEANREGDELAVKLAGVETELAEKKGLIQEYETDLANAKAKLDDALAQIAALQVELADAAETFEALVAPAAT